MVCHHLEYFVQFWSPYLKEVTADLEKLQKIASKMIRKLEHLSFEEKLKSMGLFSLEKRRIREYMIATDGSHVDLQWESLIQVQFHLGDQQDFGGMNESTFYQT